MGVSRKETPKKGRRYAPRRFKIKKVMGEIPHTHFIHRKFCEDNKYITYKHLQTPWNYSANKKKEFEIQRRGESIKWQSNKTPPHFQKNK